MPIGPDTILLTFLIFCRIGGCLMLMPGFSSARIGVQARLFMAIAVSLALAPLVLPRLQSVSTDLAPARVFLLIASETATGALIGLMGRCFFVALQFMATSAAMFIGFAGMPGTPIEDAEPLPDLSSFVTLTATVLFFLADLHWEVFRALLASYSVLSVSEPFSAQSGLRDLASALSDAFLVALQITSPFLVYSLIINLTFGLANRLTPQIPVYFISLPFVLAGGLLLLYFAVGEFLRLFMAAFAGWLVHG